MTSNLDSAKQQQFENWKKRQQQQSEKARKWSEGRVVEELEKRAKSEGWTTEKHPGNEPGVDLKLGKDNRIIIVEAKGERPKQKHAGGRVEAALGAIIMDMKEENPDKVYCVAFPATEDFQKVVCEIPTTPRQRLGLSIIFVECPTGLLKVLRPDAEDAIDLSKFDELLHAG